MDYIAFKFAHLDDLEMREIVDSLFQMGFNSFQTSGKLINPTKETIWVNSNNKLEVVFVTDNSYWDGILLNFSGINAKAFYLLIKEGEID